MIQTVEQACRFNPAIQDYRMSQGIENLAALIDAAGDGREFFARNFVTHGMEQLFCDEVVSCLSVEVPRSLFVHRSPGVTCNAPAAPADSFAPNN